MTQGLSLEPSLSYSPRGLFAHLQSFNRHDWAHSLRAPSGSLPPTLTLHHLALYSVGRKPIFTEIKIFNLKKTLCFIYTVVILNHSLTLERCSHFNKHWSTTLWIRGTGKSSGCELSGSTKTENQTKYGFILSHDLISKIQEIGNKKTPPQSTALQW